MHCTGHHRCSMKRCLRTKRLHVNDLIGKKKRETQPGICTLPGTRIRHLRRIRTFHPNHQSSDQQQNQKSVRAVSLNALPKTSMKQRVNAEREKNFTSNKPRYNELRTATLLDLHWQVALNCSNIMRRNGGPDDSSSVYPAVHLHWLQLCLQANESHLAVRPRLHVNWSLTVRYPRM